MGNPRPRYAWLMLVASFVSVAGCDGCEDKKAGLGAAKALAAASAHGAVDKAFDRAAAPQLDMMEFIKDFTDDPGKANAKYTGQLFKVMGIVREVAGERVVLHDRLGAVVCTLPPEQAGNLIVGQPATVTGFVTPAGGHVAARLQSCELLPRP
ncbi:OB-fold putative lipoprotein [Pendulispora rubella]|uniref:OB-fold putative lipoprotein n=1 Tax=Pendulispora rubella TaxID=2741070 RepID=A0ABZ2LHH8_9BACT